MKRLKIDRQSSAANQLSQKRNSLNQQPLIVPYKIDWRPASPSNIQNHSNSKVFFQNMKAQLSTIKNDFQKLIRRQINLKLDNDQPLKPSNTNKQKSCSTARKNVKIQKEKKQPVKNGRDQDQQFNSILSLQKNFACSSGPDLKQVLAKSLQVRDQKVITSVFQAVEIPKKQQVYNKSAKEQHKVLKQRIFELQKEIEAQRDKVKISEKEITVFMQQKNTKQSVISQLMNELKTKKTIIQQQHQQIVNLNASIESLNMERQNILAQGQNFIHERNFLNQHLSELSFHHNQLNIAYQQSLAQNAQQRESVMNLQRFCQDLQRRCADIEGEGRRKIQYLQKDIQQYQKRQDMFSREIENLKIQLQRKSSHFYASDPKIQVEMNDQIAQLQNQVFHLEKQVQIEKQLHQNLANKYLEQATHGNDMEQIARNFQEKIAMLVEQNTKLKNRVNLAQSKAESIIQQNKSYLYNIKLYQQRQRVQANKKQISTNQWETLTQQIQKLKLENTKLCEQIQMSHIITQNEKEVKDDEKPQTLMKLNYDQRTQIEQLKANLMTFFQQNQTLKQELISQKAKILKFSQGNLSGWISDELEHTKDQNKVLRQLVFSVLAQKVGKKQEQGQLEYFVRKIEEFKTHLNV